VLRHSATLGPRLRKDQIEDFIWIYGWYTDLKHQKYWFLMGFNKHQIWVSSIKRNDFWRVLSIKHDDFRWDLSGILVWGGKS
jgi:hypothetical protein